MPFVCEGYLGGADWLLKWAGQFGQQKINESQLNASKLLHGPVFMLVIHEFWFFTTS